jgi:hypothetical protein
MLRKIVIAIKVAFRAMMRAIGGAWATLFGDGGGEDIVVDDDDETADLTPEKSTEDEPDPMADYKKRLEVQRQAAAVVAYACDADVDGKRPVPAPCLTRIQRSWLAGLGAGDLRLIADSDRETVCGHLGSGPYIQGLLRVRELRALALQPLMNRDGNEASAWKYDSTPTFPH